MAEKKEYKPGIRKIKNFFSKKINPNSPRARLERQKEQKLRAKGIGTSGDTDTEFKGSVKNLTSKGMVRKMEDAKPTATVGAPKAKVAPSRANKTPTKKPSTASKVKAGLSAFQKAFAQARKEGKKDFKFDDKMYAAVTRQEVQRSGSSNLGEYLNKLKRKNPTIAKAPGQADTFKEGGSVPKGAVQLPRKLTPSEAEKIRKLMPKDFERDFDRRKVEKRKPNIRTLPLKPGTKVEPKTLPLKPGTKSKAQYLKKMSGAAVSEKEMKKMKKYQRGGSVNRNEMDLERSIESEKARQAIQRSLANPETKKANESVARMDRQRTKGRETPMGRKDRTENPFLIVDGKAVRPRDLPSVGAPTASRRMLEEMSGAALSDNEMRSIMQQMAKPQRMDTMKKGGSVMARGCKMGRKKPTKLY